VRFRAVVFVCCIFALVSSAWAGDIPGAVNDLQSRAGELAKRLKVKPADNGKAKELAVETYKSYKSPAFQERLKEETERIKRLLISGKQEVFSPVQRRRIALGPDERLYVFISSSIPLSTLRHYMGDIDRLHDPNVIVVLRGFVNGAKRVKPTFDFLSRLLVKDPGCDYYSGRCSLFDVPIEIDPLLFRRYHIEEVPAFLYVSGIQVVDPDKSEGLLGNAKVGEAYLIAGDVSLRYVLDRLGSASGSERLRMLAEELDRGFYNAPGQGR